MTTRAAPISRRLSRTNTSLTGTSRENLLSKAIRRLSAGLMLCGAGSTLALGLGELEHNSYIGQPLTASVSILDTKDEYNPTEIKIRQLSAQEAAATLNIDILDNNYRLNLTTTETNGDLQIQITSRQAINEPFVDFVLELSWSDGQVLREYTLLMDPPPALAASATTESVTPVPREIPKPTEQPTSRFEPGTLGGGYTIRKGDTLSQIAEQWRLDSSHSLVATKQWLLQNNPRAFRNRDPNQLMLGARLKLPTANNIPALDLAPGRADHTALAAANGIPLAPSEHQPLQAPPADTTSTAHNQSPLSGKLHLGKQTVLEPAELEQMVQQQPIEEMRDLINITQETTDRIIRENGELRQRIDNIENSDYIKGMEQLIALQRDEIANLRASLNAQPAVFTSATPAPATVKTGAPSGEASRIASPSTLSSTPANDFSQSAAGPWFWLLAGLSAFLALIISALTAYRLGQRSGDPQQGTTSEDTATAIAISNDPGNDGLGPITTLDDLGEEEIIPLQLDGDTEEQPSTLLCDIDLLPEDEDLLGSSDNHPLTLQVPEATILDRTLDDSLSEASLPEVETEELNENVDFSANLSSLKPDSSDPQSLQKPEVPENLPFTAEELEDSELTFDLELDADFTEAQDQEMPPEFKDDLAEIDLNLSLLEEDIFKNSRDDTDPNLSALEENIFKDNRDDIDELISRAMIFASFGDFDKAEEILISELANYPNEKRIADTLVQFSDDRKKAEKQ